MEVSARKNCGYPGISAEECASRECCFSNAIWQVPWCFFPQSVEGRRLSWEVAGDCHRPQCCPARLRLETPSRLLLEVELLHPSPLAGVPGSWYWSVSVLLRPGFRQTESLAPCGWRAGPGARPLSSLLPYLCVLPTAGPPWHSLEGLPQWPACHPASAGW